jgi:serine kinase of HPr protein (carbohydrate metabolism regulator)
MKTLIEKSIEIYGIGVTDVKTVFHLNTIPEIAENATEQLKQEVKLKEFENEKIKKSKNFKPLTVISARKLSVWFKYKEDEKEVESRIQLTLPKSDSEEVIKNFILNSINTHLGK